MSPTDFAPFRSLRRHEEYFLVGGDLFFLVEQSQFRVHRYFFERESKYFQSKLAPPASPGSLALGGTESTAIVLDDVKADDFAKFLWVFYNPKYSLYNAAVADWVAILELAHRWDFPEVKNLAVRELEKQEMDNIERVVVYHKNEVDRSLLIPRYAALCQREEPLSLDEGLRLGMETTLNIVRARECARSSPSADGTRSPAPANIDLQELGGLIKGLFHIVDAKPVEPTPAAVQPTKAAVEPTHAPVTNGVPPVANGTTPEPIANGSATVGDIFGESELFKTSGESSEQNSAPVNGTDTTKANGNANGIHVDTNTAESPNPEPTPSTPSGGGRGKGNKKR